MKLKFKPKFRFNKRHFLALFLAILGVSGVVIGVVLGFRQIETEGCPHAGSEIANGTSVKKVVDSNKNQTKIKDRSFSVMTITKEESANLYDYNFGTTWLLSKSKSITTKATEKRTTETNAETYYFATNAHVINGENSNESWSNEEWKKKTDFYFGYNETNVNLKMANYTKLPNKPDVVFEPKNITRASKSNLTIDFAVFSLRLTDTNSVSRQTIDNSQTKLIQKIKTAAEKKLEVDTTNNSSYNNLSIAGFPASGVIRQDYPLARRVSYQISGQLENQSEKRPHWNSAAYDLGVNNLNICGGSSGSLVLTNEGKIFGLYWGIGTNETTKKVTGFVTKLAVNDKYNLINNNNNSSSSSSSSSSSFCSQISNNAEICSTNNTT